MSEPVPAVELAAFSSPDAMATSWEQGRAELAKASCGCRKPHPRSSVPG